MTYAPEEHADTPSPNFSVDLKPDGQAEAASAGDVGAEIVALARTCPAPGRFLSGALQAIAAHFNAPYAAVYVRHASEIIQDDCHRGATDPGFWKSSLQEFLTDALSEPRPRAKLLQARDGAARLAFLSAPILDPSGPAIGAMALVVAPIEERDLTARLLSLESLTRLVSFAAEFIGSVHRTDAPPAGSTSASAVAKALARAATCTTTEELAFALTNELCNKLGCAQVALGMVRSATVRVICLSGLDSVHHQSPGVAAIRSAMEECLDAGRPIIAQSEGEWAVAGDAPAYRLHNQWRNQVGDDAVASIPLKTGADITAVISLRRRAEQPFRFEQIEEIRARIEPFAHGLALTRRASRSLPRHALDRAQEITRNLLAPGRAGRKALTLAVALAVCTFLFGSLPYRVSVPCVIRPADIRHLAAPFDAVIASAAVITGDQVTAGMVLCELDHRELDQQRAALLAELEVLERTRDRARSEKSPVEAQLAVAQQELLRAKLAVIDQRIAAAVLRAPVDGVVVNGDLRTRIGSVVPRGEPLFEIAPLTHWIVEMRVPERSASGVHAGISGEFVTFAQPDRALPLSVNRVHAHAQPHDGQNVFLAEAQLNDLPSGLRPGMEGLARLRLGWRPIRWITLHRATDYLRMHLWP